MEIEVGDYVRTKYGEFYIVLGFYERNRYNDLCIQLGDFKTKDFCGEDYQSEMKISEDIIELIEVGDILEIKEGDNICYIGLKNDTTTLNYNDIKKSIKNNECELLSIVTKEQFESIKYDVEV